MYPSTTTSIPNGVNNVQPGHTLQNAKLLDPTASQVYVNDFNTYAAADITTTLVGTGTTAITAVDGGNLLSTTTTGAADANYHQVPTASFKITANRSLFFKYKGTLSDVTNSVFYAGMIMTSATPLTANDSVFIRKATGSGALALVSRVGGVETSAAFPTAALLVAATAFELGIEIEPSGRVNAYFNPPSGHYITNGISGGRGPVATLAAPTLTTALLSPSFGLLNSTGAARTLTTDYVVAMRER